ncbi:hypothetical protein ACVWZA_002389 [Sphingomonas sp. UYAg733]
MGHRLLYIFCAREHGTQRARAARRASKPPREILLYINILLIYSYVSEITSHEISIVSPQLVSPQLVSPQLQPEEEAGFPLSRE